MSRRERTTALPRTRLRERSTHDQRRILGRTWTDRETKFAIWGAALALLLVVLGAYGYRLYYNHIIRPNRVIISVGEEDVKLKYYTDRLFDFARANQNTSLPLIQSGLLTKLEEEALTVQEARARGISLSDDEVTAAIADKLGVPVGGDGSPFDTRYRAELERTGLTDSSFRRLTLAELADTKLREQLSTEIGDTGELLTLRIVVSASEDASKAVLAKIQAGENMGTIAQTESTDLSSRANDGVRDPEPRAILNDSIRTALDGKKVGDLVGPISVEGSWVVARVEVIDPAGTYSTTQKDQLVDQKFADVLDARRAQVKIERDFTADDAEWSIAHTDGDTSTVTTDTTTAP